MKITSTLTLASLLVAALCTGCKPDETTANKGDSADASVPAAPGESAEWLTDFPAALAQAKAENKRVFLDFTGSDWCSACKLIKKKVLSTSEFSAFAKKNLILVEVDFPMNKTQPDALKAANKALADKFKVDGYPTLVVTDADGKELWREEGYDDEAPAKYVAKLAAIKAK